MRKKSAAGSRKSTGRGPASAVRIGAGRWRGRRLEVPPGARPTSARAREALFGILQQSVPGACVLDLYAGSGAVGLEAVSRGASKAILVERECAALDRNLERLSPREGEIEVLRGDVSRALRLLRERGERFDLVFADPPYGAAVPPALTRAAGELLSGGGLLVVQRNALDASPPEAEGLWLTHRRAYGRNVFHFFSPSLGARRAPGRPSPR